MTPTEGLKVLSAKFNEETLNIADNTLITTEIEEDSDLTVEFAWDGDIKFDYSVGVDTINGCDFCVFRQSDAIVIKNIESYSQINRFTFTGSKLESSFSDEAGSVKINVEPGIYIITINGFAY